MVANVIAGYNSCIFCYGQTGSGVSFVFLQPCWGNSCLSTYGNHCPPLSIWQSPRANAGSTLVNPPDRCAPAGKTHTMLGTLDGPECGLAPRTCEGLIASAAELQRQQEAAGISCHIAMRVGCVEVRKLAPIPHAALL